MAWPKVEQPGHPDEFGRFTPALRSSVGAHYDPAGSLEGSLEGRPLPFCIHWWRALLRQELRPRARQKVVLELGLFIGKLGRANVCALYSDGVEIPSDYHGVLYVRYQWQYASETRVTELRRGLARVERKQFALKLREIQRRHRWVAGFVFGLRNGVEYHAALQAAPRSGGLLMAVLSAAHVRFSACAGG